MTSPTKRNEDDSSDSFFHFAEEEGGMRHKKRTKLGPEQGQHSEPHETDYQADQSSHDIMDSVVTLPINFMDQATGPSASVLLPEQPVAWNSHFHSTQSPSIPRNTMRGPVCQGVDQFTAEDCLLNAILLNRQRHQQELFLAYQRLTVQSPHSMTLPASFNRFSALPSEMGLQERDVSQVHPHQPVAESKERQGHHSVGQAQGHIHGSTRPRVQAQAQTNVSARTLPKTAKPRRPLSSFNLFFKAERLKLKEEYSTLSFRFMGQEISRRWKLLKDRKKYDDLALADKQRYASEMAEYKQSMQVALTQAFDEQRKQVPDRAYQEYLDRLQDDEPPSRRRK